MLRKNLNLKLMKEDLVREIFQRYLHKLGKVVKTKAKSASGPDFVVEGKAYECKGTKFDEKKLFSQLLSYGLQYSQISLVIPYNALNFTFLWKLEALEKFLGDNPNQSIEIYLIAPHEGESYAIYRRSYARSLYFEISSILHRLIPEFTKLSIEEKESKVLNFLKGIESQIKEEFRKLIIEKIQETKTTWEGALINLNS
jgi:hypothetical protein